MKAIVTLSLLLIAISNPAYAIDLCNTESTGAMKECLIQQTGHIQEANLENEYFVVTTNRAKSDLLKIISHFDDRDDAFARKVQATKSAIRSAKALAFVVQYEDEPSIHYFAISSEGILTEVIDFSVIDLKETFDKIQDRYTFILHVQPISESLQESLDWSYQE